MPSPDFAGGFFACDEPWGRALQCRALPAGARHLFSSRDVDVRAEAPDASAVWGRIAASMGVAPPCLLRARQVHGRAVLAARIGGGPPPAPASVDADILVSDDPGVAVTVRVADCAPVLIADARLGVVAAVHAGWRGTALGAVRAGVDALSREFGSHPRDLHAAIGPCIGAEAYEVGEEVRAAFEAEGHGAAALQRWFRQRTGSRPHLDVWQANADQLIEAGVPEAKIACARVCTASRPDWFFSHRREGAAAGRMVAAIRAFTP